MTDKQMLRFASLFPISVVFLIAILGGVSLTFGAGSSSAMAALLPALAVMISSTFLSVLVEKQAGRIDELERQLAENKGDDS